ncbi:murein biosynthesis integral membrane protein MurJ [Gleimia hominis]|uniref:murein biosynthesis integral membrane protein MurJ n=1 Tax=Gleimia hominis TaxID=595468 RepID=UPI000C809766|nr:lipid II flippase MurJ [Gleimia hominis]WIK64167.1 lipid II flippase MurJ [Gleimia hominis]
MSPDNEELVGDPKQTSIARSTAIMAAGTIVSRLLGFVRWGLLLVAVGGTGANDAFQVANTLPNTVFNMLAAGLLDAILVPQIVRAFKTRGGSAYVNRLLTLAGLILLGLTTLMVIGAGVLVEISAAQMDPQWKHLAIIFAVWCLPQIFFYGLYSLLGETLNARGVFGPYMWTPVVNNVVAIVGLLVFMMVYGTGGDLLDAATWDWSRTALLAAPTTLGVVVQAVMLIPFLRSAGVRLRLDFHFRGANLRSASKLTAWVFATLTVGQLGYLSTSNIAAAANSWGVAHDTFAPANAAMSYTFMVYMLPQSIISVSIATALFTRLAASAADHDHLMMAQQYHFGVRITSMLTLWLAACVGAAAAPVFQALGPNNSVEILSGFVDVLIALLPGLAGAAVILFSQRVFYSLEDGRPVFFTVLVPTLCGIALAWTLKAFIHPTFWLLGASVADSLSRIAQGVIAAFYVKHKLPDADPLRVINDALRYGFFAISAALVGAAFLHVVGPFATGSALVCLLGALWRGLFTGVIVTGVFFGFLIAFDRANSQRALVVLSRRIPPLRRFL